MMRPELVQFFDEYQDMMVIRAFDLDRSPQTAEGFPIRAIPTQFFFDANGDPFRPTDLALGSTFELLTDDAGNHILTRHVGALDFDDLVAIYQDMAAQ
ncbi:MAG: hypothetical protein FWE87_01155 [Coriobacteriia bacterium]|nr:hypothetical protein [Coriobacteriia bacterium]